MLEYILDGGYMMLPLMVLSVLAVAIIIDRVRAFRLAEGDTHALREKVISELEEGSIDRAISCCEQAHGPVAAVVLVGLYKYRQLAARERSTAEIEANVKETMNDYAPHVIQALEKRLNLLTMIASVSPLLGMTGTVTGMIGAFQEMAAAGVDAAGVSGGISEALITTAAGLLIAMPAVVAYSIFSKKIDSYVLDIEETAARLIDFITLEHVED